MRRSAIHIAESSSRSSRSNPFIWSSSSSRSFGCTSPSCHLSPRSINRHVEPLRTYTSSTGSSSSSKHVFVHGHSHKHQGDDSVSLSLSRNARDLHSSARISASAATATAAQAEHRVEYDDQPGSWDYPDEEPLPPMRDHGRARGGFRLAEAHDDWVLGGEYDLTPPSISTSEFQHDPSPITCEYDLPPPPVDDYDPTLPSTTTSTSRRRKKRIVREREVAPMPPLPAGEMPEDGLSRFDWRDTSLSAKPVPDTVGRGRLWYPHLAEIRRRKADKLQLQDGDIFHDEIKRYINQYVPLPLYQRAHWDQSKWTGRHQKRKLIVGTSFEPLLQAEHDESERMLLQRLKDWSSDRLDKEGYMLEKLGARVEKGMKPVEGVLVTFNKTGKDDNKPLTPHHKIE